MAEMQSQVHTPRENVKVDVPNILCIRDDGYLCMATESALSLNPKLKRYAGDVNATLQERMLYVRGIDVKSGGSVAEAVERGTVDITRMSLADLKEYASDTYGLDLSDKKVDRAKALVAVIDAREKQEAAEKAKGSAGAGLGIGSA